MRIAARIAFASLMSSLCLSGALAQEVQYESISSGTLSGKLIVQWLEPDLFLFLPDKDKPLTFVRSNGQRITPGRMRTDGGSIPRAIWILRNYSPWGFAPAFIVHDWLFEMRHCKYAGHEGLTLQESGMIMAEIMKTMIETKKVDAGPLTVRSMYVAVTSPVAKMHWDDGKCSPDQPDLFKPKPIQTYELSY